MKEVKSSHFNLIAFFILSFTVFGITQTVFAQQKRVIQLSGVVLGQDDRDSVLTLPGVHVYVPKAGRGQTTNSVAIQPGTSSFGRRTTAEPPINLCIFI